ncbi:hypothetical protein BGZ57DRAFT_919784 [Hyaloscypha finlandica]|nr:hypothetical protein BGZ57DRAFT_919784 [Hyaloscypha finlandica]
MESKRPSAVTLKEMIINSVTPSSEIDFFGSCCSTGVVRSRPSAGQCPPIGSNPRRDPENKAALEVPLRGQTSTAAVAWENEKRLFIQGDDGAILQATWRDGDLNWRGATVKDKIAYGKIDSPLAATAWRRKDRLDQPTIRVYFLDTKNRLRERIWDPLLEWRDGPLNEKCIQAAPEGQLAVTSWNSGNICLSYQTKDGAIGIMHGSPDGKWWQNRAKTGMAAPGSSLGILSFPKRKQREIRLYYQDKKSSRLKELCWSHTHDNARGDAEPIQREVAGALKLAAITAIAVGGKVPDLRLYSSSSEGIVEGRFKGGWRRQPIASSEDVKNSRVTATHWGSGNISIFAVKGGKLVETQCENGNWKSATVSETVMLDNNSSRPWEKAIMGVNQPDSVNRVSGGNGKETGLSKSGATKPGLFIAKNNPVATLTASSITILLGYVLFRWSPGACYKSL